MKQAASPAPTARARASLAKEHAEARAAKVTPGGDFERARILRDAGGYPFAVGTDNGDVVIQVAATAPRGTIRISPAHADTLTAVIIEAAARAATAPAGGAG